MKSLRLVALLVVFAPAAARAGADAHYQDLIVGERAAGMGGAFIALADEATGAHYNPAGIVGHGPLMLQLSMTAYKLRSRSVAIAEWCGKTFDHTEQSLFSFPGSFGVVARLPRAGRLEHALGLTLVLPHAHRWSQFYAEDKIPCGPLSFGAAEAWVGVDRELKGGLTYSARPWPWLQAGLTVGVSARSITSAISFDKVIENPPEPWRPESFMASSDATIWSLTARLGLILRPAAGLRAGVTLSSPYLRLAGAGRLYIVNGHDDPTKWRQTEEILLEDVEHRWEVPLAVGVGLAYTFGEILTVAADASLHGEVGRYAEYEHPQLPEWFVQEFANERALVVNANVGAELAMSRGVALRLGFFTNFSSSAREDKIDLFGFTTGATLRRGPTSISASVQAQIGSGTFSKYVFRYDDARGQYEHSEQQVDARDLALFLTIGGGLDLR
jgi:long-chain fatty acid transport protein